MISRPHVIFISCLFCGFILLFFLYHRGLVRLNYPSDNKYPIKGIDISHHQNIIDWNKLRLESDIQFAYIKSTEGKDYTDSLFIYNQVEASKNQFDIGFYHYFRLCTSGKRQAEHFIRQTLKYNSQLPPVVDLEFHGNCDLAWTNVQLKTEIQLFINIVEENCGQPVIIYTTLKFYKSHLANTSISNPIWIRNILLKPNIDSNLVIWQYADNGRLAGIEGPVDLNVFLGSKQEYDDFKNASLY